MAAIIPLGGGTCFMHLGAQKDAGTSALRFRVTSYLFIPGKLLFFPQIHENVLA